jgi:hypothetical protein
MKHTDMKIDGSVALVSLRNSNGSAQRMIYRMHVVADTRLGVVRESSCT